MRGGAVAGHLDLLDRSRRLAACLAAHGIGGRRRRRARAVGGRPRPRPAVPVQRPRVPRGDGRLLPRPGRARRTSTTATPRPRWPSSSPTAGPAAAVVHLRFAATLLERRPSGRARPRPRPRRRRRQRRRPARRRARYEDALAGADPAGSGRRRRHPTTSTSSTPAAPPAGPRACSGARPTSSPAPSASTGTRRASWPPPPRPPTRRAAHAAGPAAHARRRPLERPLVPRRRRHGGVPGPRRPLRPRRHPRHHRPRSAARPSTSSATPSPSRCSTPRTRRTRDLSSLRHVVTGGAVLSATDQGTVGRPRSRGSGSSTSSARRSRAARASPGATGPGPLRAAGPPASCWPTTAAAVLGPARTDVGWLATTGAIPRGYLGDPAKTAATFPVVDGVRYVVAGDRARRRPDGTIELLGRDAGHHQHRRREGVRRGGRGRPQGPPGRARRRRRRAPVGTLGLRGRGRRRPPRRRRRSTDDELRDAAASIAGPLQAPEGVRPGPQRAAHRLRQGRLFVGDDRSLCQHPRCEASPVTFDCPRCGTAADEDLYGPCTPCRGQLRERFTRRRRDARRGRRLRAEDERRAQRGRHQGLSMDGGQAVRDVVVIGAGPAGLTAAYELGKRGGNLHRARVRRRGRRHQPDRRARRVALRHRRPPVLHQGPRGRGALARDPPGRRLPPAPAAEPHLLPRQVLRLPHPAAERPAEPRPGRGRSLRALLPLDQGPAAEGHIAARGLRRRQLRLAALPALLQDLQREGLGGAGTEISADWGAQRIKGMSLWNARVGAAASPLRRRRKLVADHQPHRVGSSTRSSGPG